MHEPAAPAVIDLGDALVGLFPAQVARMLPPAARQRNDAQWIIGVHYAADDRAVHADFWERHPAGDEVLCLLDGDISVTLDADGQRHRLRLAPGQALVVPRGAWHRLHVNQPGRLMFITPSVGSEHRRVDAAEKAQDEEQDQSKDQEEP